MACTYLGEKKSTRSGAFGGGKGEYRKTLLVETTSQIDDANAVLAVVPMRLGTPWVGTDGHPNPGCLCVGLSPKEVTPYMWEVDAQYSTDYKPDEKNPLNRPVVVRLTTQKVEVPIWFTKKAGEYVSNNVGEQERLALYEGIVPSNHYEPFDPPPTARESIVVLIVERNEERLDTSRLRYIDAINSDNFYNMAPGTWRCENITYEAEKQENGVWFRRATYELHWRWRGWNLQLPDMGTGYWPGGLTAKLNNPALDFKLFSGTDGDGRRLGFLNGAGDKLAVGQPVKIIGYPYQGNVLPFAALGLPGPGQNGR